LRRSAKKTSKDTKGYQLLTIHVTRRFPSQHPSAQIPASCICQAPHQRIQLALCFYCQHQITNHTSFTDVLIIYFYSGFHITEVYFLTRITISNARTMKLVAVLLILLTPVGSSHIHHVSITYGTKK
jgi:hypothetical protein